jgi:hypothetical protein
MVGRGRSAPLHTVRDWLGHTDISQTSTYLESTLTGAHEAMRQFEEQRAAAAARVQVMLTGSKQRGMRRRPRRARARRAARNRQLTQSGRGADALETFPVGSFAVDRSVHRAADAWCVTP